ncbi:hypothetical protein ALT785_240134 [Alteromonas infernus]
MSTTYCSSWRFACSLSCTVSIGNCFKPTGFDWAELACSAATASDDIKQNEKISIVNANNVFFCVANVFEPIRLLFLVTYFIGYSRSDTTSPLNCR